MWMLRFGVAASSVGFVVGCGGAKPAAQVAAPPSVAAAPVEVALPLTPVPAPPELFAVARVASAAKIADMAVAWSGLPTDWRALLAKHTNGFDKVAMLTAPVDFAAMLDPTATGEPRVVWAGAFGVSSTDAAASFFRQQGAQVASDKGGAYRIQLESDLSCVATRALGLAPARVVCSDRPERAEMLAPYMTRGLPTETFGASDVHIHAVAEPIRKRFGAQLVLVKTVGVPFALRELELDHPKFDRALRDALYGAADELLALSYDFDRIDIDATPNAEQTAVDTSLMLGFAGQRSWLSQVFVRTAGKGGPAPELFWSLPVESTSAGYSGHSDPEHNRGLSAALREVADGWLDYHELPERRRAPLVEAFEQMLLIDGRSVNAMLPTPQIASGTSPEAQRLRKAYALGLTGQVVALDHDGDKVQRFLGELVKSVNDPSLRRHLTKVKLLEAGQLPSAVERAPHLAKNLPKGARAYEFSIPSSVIDKATPLLAKKGAHAVGAKDGEMLKFVVIVAPDGPLTWFAWGPTDEPLVAWLTEVRSGKTTLATRAGLAPLRTESSISAGYVSAAALFAGIAARLGGDQGMPDENSLQRLPHRGETPMLWRMTVDPRGPSIKAQLRVPREVVEDSVAFAASNAAGASRPVQ